MTMVENKKTFGTWEWSVKTINFITGCQHDCKYCYSKSMSVRFKRSTTKNWINEVVRTQELTKRIPKYKGTVMFPSSHDITPEHLTESIFMLRNVLKSGNQVLIVSKPHLECIQRICEIFTDYKDKILFRFTIGSTDSEILRFWENNSTSFEERLECLKLSYNMGFKTSVSSEPLLSKNVDDLISKLSPFITDTIWIGKPNKLLYRVRMNGFDDTETIEKCNEWNDWISNPEFLLSIYKKNKENPKIRWKQSIRDEIMNLLK